MIHLNRFVILSILIIQLFVAACASAPADQGNIEATVAAILEATGQAKNSKATITALEAALASAQELATATAMPIAVVEVATPEAPAPVVQKISQEAAVATAVAATRQTQDRMATGVAATLTAVAINTPIPTNTPLPPVEIPVYCDDFGDSPWHLSSADRHIVFFWSWNTTTTEYQGDYLASATFLLSIDGIRLDPNRANIVFLEEANSSVTVRWYMPPILLTPGNHFVEFDDVFANPVLDGYDMNDDGKLDVYEGQYTHTCKIVVG